MSKYHVTTKRTKDTKDSEIITFQFLNFVLFATSFENTGRRSISQLGTLRLRHSSKECWNQADMDVSGRILRTWMPIHAGMTKLHLFHSLWASVRS
jgi:hypothetical protein